MRRVDNRKKKIDAILIGELAETKPLEDVADMEMLWRRKQKHGVGNRIHGDINQRRACREWKHLNELARFSKSGPG
jgi:hypothetical protein